MKQLKIDYRKTYNIPEGITDKQEEVIRKYKELKNYKLTGNFFGISRQRVEQIIKRFRPYDTELQALYKKKKHIDESCKECHRPFSRFKYNSGGLCSACAGYINKYPDRIGKRRRLLSLPKNCTKCNREFKTKKEGSTWKTRRVGRNDLCGKCFSLTYRYKTHQKKWYSNPENREKKLNQYRKYNQEHKEELYAKQKEWNKSHRKKIARKQRKYWQLRKIKLNLQKEIEKRKQLEERKKALYESYLRR
ncbi:MAG: hypothetical protein PHE73_09255 [Sulfurovaceae bacterium]|nr:hypothetical protein [Sulfurovaceae bacterium]